MWCGCSIATLVNFWFVVHYVQTHAVETTRHVVHLMPPLAVRV